MAFADTDFTLPRDAYATFDALTLKKLIKQRLTQGGIFTDQDFEDIREGIITSPTGIYSAQI